MTRAELEREILRRLRRQVEESTLPRTCVHGHTLCGNHPPDLEADRTIVLDRSQYRRVDPPQAREGRR